MKMNKYHCWINYLRLHPAKDTKKKNSNIETARQTGGCKKLKKNDMRRLSNRFQSKKTYKEL